MKHTDGAPEEVLAIAHPHWTQFPPVHPMVQVGKNMFLFGKLLVFMCFLILSALLWRDVLRPLGDQRGGERARHIRVPKVSLFPFKKNKKNFFPFPQMSLNH